MDDLVASNRKSKPDLKSLCLCVASGFGVLLVMIIVLAPFIRTWYRRDGTFEGIQLLIPGRINCILLYKGGKLESTLHFGSGGQGKIAQPTPVP